MMSLIVPVAGVDVSGPARWYGSRARNQIVAVSMPAQCPEEDRHCTEYRSVTLHIQARNQIWVSIDDVEWVVRYLWMQYQLRGVHTVADDDVGPQCPLEGPVRQLALPDAPVAASD